jgi:hypothetical protein
VAQALVKYEAARRALAEAKRIDEVKAIRDQAAAMRAYAKLSKDRQMEADAQAIRLRAERRIGELMAQQAKAIGKAKGAKGIGTSAGYNKTRTQQPATLAEAGIDKNLADRARKLAALPEKVFDAAMDVRKTGKVPTMGLIDALADAAVDRELGDKTKPREKAMPKPSPLYDPWAKLSRAVRDLADQDVAQLPGLAQQARRVGFFDIDLEHASKAVATLAAWLSALQREAQHGQEGSQQRGNSETGREGTRATAAE